MLRASCLCGGVRLTVTGRHSGIAHCHCSRCRKLSGGGSFAQVLVEAVGLHWASGEDLVVQFELPSGYGSAFCRVCGSPAPESNPQKTLYRIPVGLFDGDPALVVTEHIFVGSKACWEVIGDTGAQFEGDGPPRTDLSAYDAEETARGI